MAQKQKQKQRRPKLEPVVHSSARGGGGGMAPGRVSDSSGALPPAYLMGHKPTQHSRHGGKSKVTVTPDTAPSSALVQAQVFKQEPNWAKAAGAPGGALALPQQLPSPPASVSAEPRQSNQRLTGVIYLLAGHPAVPWLRQLEGALQGPPPSQPSFTVAVCFEQNSQSVKRTLARLIGQILYELPSGGHGAGASVSAARPLKWDTIQREVLWKYLKRRGRNSLYAYVEQGSTDATQLHEYAQGVLRSLRRPLDTIVAEVLRTASLNSTGFGQDTASVARPCAAGDAAVTVATALPWAGATDGTVAVDYPITPCVDGPDTADDTGVRYCSWPGCDYSSASAGHLVRHVRVHTNEKPYKCTWAGCTYAAKQSCHLDQHMCKHTGERPFGCEVDDCAFTATRSWHLARHVRTKHPEAAQMMEEVHLDASAIQSS